MASSRGVSTCTALEAASSRCGFAGHDCIGVVRLREREQVVVIGVGGLHRARVIPLSLDTPITVCGTLPSGMDSTIRLIVPGSSWDSAGT